MSIHDAPNHPWLREDHVARIPSSAFGNIRRRIRNRNREYPDPAIGLGRAADWSSIHHHSSAAITIRGRDEQLLSRFIVDIFEL